MKKRIRYLFDLLTTKKDQLVGQILEAQMKKTLKGDFYMQCKKDLNELKTTTQQIKNMTKKNLLQL